MTVTLPMLAALCYGVCHFVNGMLSRRTPGMAIGALAQIGGSAIVVLAAPFFPAPHVTAVSLGWGALSGVGSASLAFLYRGMERGKISVVSPVSEVTASLLPVVFGLVIGERFGAIGVAGVVLSLLAIWLVSRARPAGDSGSPSAGPSAGPGAAPAPSATKPRRAIGVGDGLLGGAGVALTWVALSEVAPAAGLWPLVVSRLVSLVVMAQMCRSLRVPLRTTPGVLAVASVAGALGTVATGLYMFAARIGLVSIASVITALYPAIPVALAMLILKERLTGKQLTGLALAAVAVVLLAQAE